MDRLLSSQPLEDSSPRPNARRLPGGPPAPSRPSPLAGPHHRPILFGAPILRALLDGAKTQTRRVLMQAVGPGLSAGIEDEAGVADLSRLHGDGPGHEVRERTRRVPCPNGAPGNRLSVCETFRGPLDDDTFGYRATHDGPFTWDTYTWKPSIHMSRATSRITLDVTEVHVERLQDISEDCSVEGIEEGIGSFDDFAHADMAYRLGLCIDDAKPLFALLPWESINRPGSWDANRCLWAASFRRIQP